MTAITLLPVVIIVIELWFIIERRRRVVVIMSPYQQRHIFSLRVIFKIWILCSVAWFLARYAVPCPIREFSDDTHPYWPMLVLSAM